VKIAEFFKGKRVLVTGHTGFKGSWLCEILHGFGAKVSGYSLAPNTEPNLHSILKIEEKVEGKIADVSNYKEFLAFVKKVKPEIIIHMAAQPLVRESYDDPLWTYQTNVMGTVNVLQAIKESDSLKAAVIITTDKVYENKERGEGYRENDELGGYDPYSASKACDEIVVKSYVRSFFNPEKFADVPLVATARAGNVIGGGDWSKDRLIPDIVRSIEDEKTIVLRNPEAVRPWQHVLDPLYGYLLLAKGLYEGRKELVGAFNFAPGVGNFITVETIAKKGIESFSRGKIEIMPDESKHEAGVLKLDASKAKERLLWQAHLGMEECLEWTFEWYKRDSAGEDMLNYTQGQIEKYFEMLEK